MFEAVLSDDGTVISLQSAGRHHDVLRPRPTSSHCASATVDVMLECGQRMKHLLAAV